jgi:hypothetical protein
VKRPCPGSPWAKLAWFWGACNVCRRSQTKPPKRWPMAGTLSMSTGAARPTDSSVEGAIHWAVGGANRPTSSLVTCGASVRVPGGMRSTTIRCWHFAVPSITGPSIRCLRVINSGYGKRKNDRRLPASKRCQDSREGCIRPYDAHRDRYSSIARKNSAEGGPIGS